MTNFAKLSPHFWKDKRVFLTGHLGFKGAWLTVLLHSLGAKVIGYSLVPPYRPYLGEVLNIKNLCIKNYIADICDYKLLSIALQETDPEIVIHMAAQPLVLDSYKDPLGTIQSNVTGTANILQASRNLKNLHSILVITTDKCYKNKETHIPYKEEDELGGRDVYSASKACAEIVTVAFRDSFFSERNAPLIKTARAGNVIGGGDWSHNRLVPDIVRHIYESQPLHIRHPQAIRPWQHVSEPLIGYLLLLQFMGESPQQIGSSAYNFGPNEKQVASVESILRLFSLHKQLSFDQSNTSHHESHFLLLDSQKALSDLGWQSQLSLEETIHLTKEWYERFYRKESREELTKNMLDSFSLGIPPEKKFKNL